MIDVIPRGDQRPGEEDVSVPGRGAQRGCRERRMFASLSPTPRPPCFVRRHLTLSGVAGRCFVTPHYLTLRARALSSPLLGYLPTNLTTPEIARQLSVSRNTVEIHIRHLYAKFGTHHRAEAVDLARALGLPASARTDPASR